MITTNQQSMMIRQAYKFELVLDADQSYRLEVLMGCSRFVWNAALAECNRILEAGERLPGNNGYGGYSSWITYWKDQTDTAFLVDAYTDNLQQKLRDLDRAWKDCFDKTQPDKRRPRFKRKSVDADNSIRFVNFEKYCQLDNRRVKLPAKLGWLRFRKSRKIKGIIKNCTITKAAGRYFISFQVERKYTVPKTQPTAQVGIDLGIKQCFSLSNGDVIEPLNSFKHHRQKLARLQRQLAKKKRFSNNWKRHKRKITRLHRKIAHCRADYLHKSTTAICKNHALVVIEGLKVKNMSASAKGTLENPGRRVKQKSGLNRSILDQGWHEARRQLEYKQAWSGGLLIAVPPRYTSQRCSQCGYAHADNRLSQSAFVCRSCGYEANADFNASVNILAAGYVVLACGESGLPDSLKQEPVPRREALAPKAAQAV